MATLYSPKLVTDGLAFYVDAGNPRSYSGSNTNYLELATDNFNRANVDPAPAPWAVIGVGGYNPIKISGNSATRGAPNDSETNSAYNIWLPNDQYAEAAVTSDETSAAYGPGVFVRGSTTANERYSAIVSPSDNKVYLTSHWGGASYALTNWSITYVSGGVVRLEVVETIISVFYQGTLLGSFSDSNLSGGKAGIRIRYNSAATSTVDNFKAGGIDPVAPFLVNKTSAGSGAGQPVVTVPTGSSLNDILLTVVCCDSGNSSGFLGPAGWTREAWFHNTGDGEDAAIYMRRAIGVESASYQFTSSNSWVASMFCYRGCDTTTYLDAAISVTGSNTSVNFPITVTATELTTVTPNTRLVWVGALDRTDADVVTTATTPNGFTFRDSASLQWDDFAVADAVKYTPGATGLISGSFAAASSQAGHCAFLVPLRSAKPSSSWYNLSGNGNHVILTNGSTYDTNTLGSLRFSSATEIRGVTSAYNLVPHSTASHSSQAWVNPSTASAGAIWCYGEWIDTSYTTGMSISGSAGHLCWTPNGYLSGQHSSGTGIPTGSWSCVGFVQNPTTVDFYVNGVLTNSVARTTGGPIGTTNPVTIGVASTNTSKGNYFSGKISSVSIYTRSLSPSEMMENYNNTKGRFN